MGYSPWGSRVRHDWAINTHTHIGTLKKNSSYNFSSVESLCCVWLFVIPWTATCQASLSITNSRSLLKLMFIELVMPSNHLILCHPLLLSPSIFPSIRVFSSELVLHVRWPKYWSFSFSISLSNDYWNIRYSLLISKSLEALEHFFEICDNFKKLADKSCSLEITKRKKNLGMLWMHKTYVDTSHPYINWVIFHMKWITCWFSYYFITLVSKNYIPVQYASLSPNLRNCLSAIITGERFLRNITGLSREEPRWQRNRTGRPLSPLQIRRKNNWTLSKLHKTTSDR